MRWKGFCFRFDPFNPTQSISFNSIDVISRTPPISFKFHQLFRRFDPCPYLLARAHVLGDAKREDGRRGSTPQRQVWAAFTFRLRQPWPEASSVVVWLRVCSEVCLSCWLVVSARLVETSRGVKCRGCADVTSGLVWLNWWGTMSELSCLRWSSLTSHTSPGQQSGCPMSSSIPPPRFQLRGICFEQKKKTDHDCRDSCAAQATVRRCTASHGRRKNSAPLSMTVFVLG